MSGSWITDLSHFLDEEGTTSTVTPSAARLADYFGSIVKAVTSQADNKTSAIATGIRCRRRPGRKRCSGEILASLDQQNALNMRKALSCLWRQRYYFRMAGYYLGSQMIALR